MPITILTLKFGQTGSKLYKQFLIERTEFCIRIRQSSQYLSQTGNYPTITTAPKDFLAIRFTLVEVAAVSIEHLLFLIIQMIVSRLEFCIHKMHIFPITCQAIKTGIHRRSHKQGITPRPTFLTQMRNSEIYTSIRRMTHQPLCTGQRRFQHILILKLFVQINVGLGYTKVIRMIHAITQLPALPRESLSHPFIICSIIRKFSPVAQAHIPSASHPATLVFRTMPGIGKFLNLPVSNLLPKFFNTLTIPYAFNSNFGYLRHIQPILIGSISSHYTCGHTKSRTIRFNQCSHG